MFEWLESMDGTFSVVSGYVERASPYIDWIRDNWLLLVLTGEIVGAVLAVKVGMYRRGLLWLGAALATLWIGVIR